MALQLGRALEGAVPARQVEYKIQGLALQTRPDSRLLQLLAIERLVCVQRFAKFEYRPWGITL